MRCIVENGKINSHHAVGARVSLSDALRLLNGLLANDFHPVSIGIQDKGNVPHAPIRQLLLKLVTGILDALAGGLQVVNADAGMAEAAVRLCVAVDDLVLRVVLGAIVVCQLDDALAVDKRVAVRGGTGAVVGEKVQIKLGGGLLNLFDKTHTEELVEFNWPSWLDFLLYGCFTGEVIKYRHTRLLGVFDPNPRFHVNGMQCMI